MPTPDFGNVQSGSASSTPGTEKSNNGGRSYVVVTGDSLSAIAKREYGDVKEWRRIFEANRDIITNPDLIYPGQTLRLP